MVALQPFTLPRELLRRLCASDDYSDDLDLLIRGRTSKSALNLRILCDLTRERNDADEFRAHVTILTMLQKAHPEVVARVLSGPHFGAWIAHCIRTLTTTTPESGDFASMKEDLGFLGCFVGAAAAHAGAQVEVPVPVRDGWIIIPGMGRLRFPGVSSAEWATLHCNRGQLSAEVAGSTGARIESRGQPPARWLPLDFVGSTFSSGHRWDVSVDAADPYLQILPRAGTSTLDIKHWHRAFASASAIIDRLYQYKATAMARSISCFVPVVAAGAEVGVSATSAAAAGAVALTQPLSGLGLAATLVHEHQHLKLNALHDLLPMFAEDGESLYYSPWRNDPRPASGLLHGAFAFLGVGDFWLRMCHQHSTSQQRGPHLELARIIRQFDLACATLASCDDLTDAGSEFVTHLADQVRRLREHDSPIEVARIADDLVVEHEIRWRLRNLAPPPADVHQLVADQLDECDTAQAFDDVPASPGFGAESELAIAAKHWAAGEPSASLVEQLILEGRYAMAQSLLIGRVRTSASHEDWIALAVVARHTDLARRYPPFFSHPEVAYALYRALRRKGLTAGLATIARALAAWSRYVAGTSISLSVLR